MTSGEWDLRALKALEEEEQKEFLALSQKSLFEPPSPPAQAKQINAQHLIHAALKERDRSQQQPPSLAATAATAATACNATNYMQLQAQQLLKLPTINEHHNHQYLLKHKAKTNNESSGGRLKFTKVLSLSAHSLTNRFAGGGSGVGGGLKKLKRTSGSNSPSHYGSPTPLYTPPPTRRCNTLHHSQPQARKAFKTLQQLEKQKQERKQEALNKNRTLQRIAGTNKTYWKYGIHSTANSITQQHQQQKLQRKKSITSELESNTSDELGSEETQPIDNVQLLQEERERLMESQSKELTTTLTDDETNAEEVGSCSVPLATDSIEMMSLMLTAASTAVKTQPALTAVTANGNNPPPPPPDIAATSVVGVVDNCNDFPKYFTLNHHNLSGAGTTALNNENEETVAYEAFHNMLSRRKSFAGEKLLRAQTLQRNSSLQHDVIQQQQKTQSRNVNSNRQLLKSSSVEAPLSSYLDFNINSTTIITNPLITNIKASNKTTATTMKSVKTSCLSSKKLLTPAALLTIPYNNGTTNGEQQREQHNQDCNQMCSSELHHYLHHQQQQHLHVQNPAYHSQHLLAQQQHHHQHHHHLLDGNDLNTSSSLIIDDELEEHIKQCSCSCNHMGYGNSMDYQVNFMLIRCNKL
ncbi:uncharacterized protein LOC124420081 [Lucilia cuprina]|uniref:uncharacterized protein LOC124420081 n=1 Tax=Lucilia cuprina TaxID=7375 RepID=UPI001F062D1F|nr:uncharacterized protein LOC124420081 [Lucilia cuprina]XP_046807781.1 uncharacterized protein LOC124420081 [Lucilia cuprina]XP_046807782.1 uncharacterized protein LOC124420081 [Lucilia cuprina]XP_046807783.1 uncharacterized protein LOC124420081 [Lucilia cuprina]XP_046807784.1 uncharacterized protein LOC124420081 [Lucilia cuprina]XP_046807785.1 uncharacterized protein LOC124420081 [Lucilia cuprina]